MTRALLLCLSLVLVACDAPPPRTPASTGEPAPTASTSAEPLWISNQRPPPAVAK